jgi:hypothetical protein
MVQKKGERQDYALTQHLRLSLRIFHELFSSGEYVVIYFMDDMASVKDDTPGILLGLISMTASQLG